MRQLNHLTIKKILLAIFALFFLVILVVLSRAWAFSDTDWVIRKGDRVKIPLSGITETFHIERDGLSQIQILFSNSRLGGGGALRLDILDASCTNILRSSTLHLVTLGSDNTVNFRFPRFPDSSGQWYCLNLTFQSTNKSGTALVFVSDAIGKTASSHLFIAAEEQPGKSLALRPAYQNASLTGDLQQLIERLSQYKPWFLKGLFVALIALLSILLTIGIVVIVILL